MEVDRLQNTHFLLKHIWKSNFFAPIEQLLDSCINGKGAYVLDIGCGPGTWILEMASEYPDAEFIGIDISPVYPSEVKPPKATFYEYNVLKRLPTIPDNTADYVHMRSMNAAFTEIEWTEVVLPELIRVLKPGGWIELCELDMQFCNPGPSGKRLSDAAIAFFATIDINGLIAAKLSSFLSETHQLRKIKQEERSSPCGKWGGTVGQLVSQSLQVAKDNIDAYIGLKTYLSDFMGVTHEEYDRIIEKSMLKKFGLI
ncbi:10095_t:CDS:2 [Ambispora gerdemannii]|uniref:10095_t:CDS:1 n=1 Tax=Ambispora gerdemannii TaxID=144530 RepID=A0A9N9ATQ1_9GLOM|nr:10095_t:CDS:2 [Ambispora gerdemannii]